MTFGRKAIKISIPIPVKISICAATVGAIGLLVIMQWTIFAVRRHVHLASLAIFPAALESQRADMAFARMNRNYRDAVVMQDKSALGNSDQEAAVALSSLDRAGKLMNFNLQRQQQIASLQTRIIDLKARARIGYAAAIDNLGSVADQKNLASLSRNSLEIQKALEALENDLASDFKGELSLINHLWILQEILEGLVLVAVVVALFFGIRSWIGEMVRKRENEILHRADQDRETERIMLRSLIDNIPDFIYVKDSQSRFLVANTFLAQAVGMDNPEDMLGKTDFDFFPADLARGFFDDEQNVIRSGIPLYGHEEKVFDQEGREVNYLTTKVPLRDDEGKIIGITGIGHNISERKESENALREAERKYREIFNEAIVGIFQTSADGRILTVNPAMATILGYSSPEEMLSEIGNDFGQIFANSRDRDAFTAALEKCEALKSFECEVARKDGQKIWITSDVRAVRQDGISIRYEGMSQDITERKFLQTRLLQAEKLESVGQLAAGIAHEINTPTQYVGDNVHFLKDIFTDFIHLVACYEQLIEAAKLDRLTTELMDKVTSVAQQIDAQYLLQEIPKAIDQTLEGISRISTLVNAMKEFSHPGTKAKVALDLNHAIQNTITVARSEWKYVADLETSFDSKLPLVQCQPGEFNQVILNLIVNAAHAIGDTIGKDRQKKGVITVTTQYRPPHAEIRIRDSGTGIPEEIRSRIFDPFFTTKEIGKGTGQGLAIARSVIVDQHRGSIDFETEAGKGTTFIILLPVQNGLTTSNLPAD